MHLFNTARYEEATRMEMELSDLLVKAHRYSYGDRTSPAKTSISRSTFSGRG